LLKLFNFETFSYIFFHHSEFILMQIEPNIDIICISLKVIVNFIDSLNSFLLDFINISLQSCIFSVFNTLFKQMHHFCGYFFASLPYLLSNTAFQLIYTNFTLLLYHLLCLFLQIPTFLFQK